MEFCWFVLTLASASRVPVATTVARASWRWGGVPALCGWSRVLWRGWSVWF